MINFNRQSAFAIKLLVEAIERQTKETIHMTVAIDALKAQLAQFKPGVTQDVLDAAIANVQAQVTALANQVAAIQVPVVDLSSEDAGIQAIADTLVPPPVVPAS